MSETALAHPVCGDVSALETIPVRLGQRRTALSVPTYRVAQVAGVDCRTVERWDAGELSGRVAPLVAYAVLLRERIVVTRHNLIVCDVQDAVPDLRGLRRVVGVRQEGLGHTLGIGGGAVGTFERRWRRFRGRGPVLSRLQQHLEGLGYGLDLAVIS